MAKEKFEKLNGNRRKVVIEAVLVFDGTVPSDAVIQQDAERIFLSKINFNKGLDGRSFICFGHRTIVESAEVKI